MLTSSTFKHNDYIPKKHTCDGQDVSPALSWTGIPPNAKSIALVMDDPDAPPGTWLHWTIYDLPGTLTGLQENTAKTETLDNGAKQGLVWGVQDSDMDRAGYWGPCPPPGKPHRYFFKIYAIDKVLNLPPKSKLSEILKAMKGHVLAQGELIGIYKR
ncbi:MAG: YbhB/YbcL family Raf kinase inhibitor-like protein [Elusimicrobia bacterium]|nr:YbhB/YbcL family Raf kinase inhibitor-like protein [Elusimicrobiota bacterium]